MKQLLMLVAALLTITVPAYARYCNSPNCQMCNRLFGPLPQYRATQPTVTYSAPVRTIPTFYPRTVSQPVHVLVGSPAPVITPIVTAEKVEHELHATPTSAVDAMLMILQPKRDSVVYDLGCGDARILIAAARDYGARGVGIEINPKTAALARKKVAAAGFSDRIRIVHGDVGRYKLDQADAIVMYLYPDTMRTFAWRLKRLQHVKVISYQHRMPGIEARKITVDGDHTFYFRR